MSRILAPLLAAAVIAASAAPAAAQPAGPKKPPSEADKKLAEAKLRQAAEQYAAGDRLGAVRTFEEAYAIFPSPIILYNLGKAYRGVGRNALAHRTLARYLREDRAVKPDRKTEIDQALRDLELVIGLVDVQVSAAGVSINVDGEDVGAAPLPGPVAVEPGVHMMVAVKGGKEVASRQVAVAAGKRVTAQLAFIAGADDDNIVRPTDPVDKGGPDTGGGFNHKLPPPPDDDDDDDVGLGVRRDAGGGKPIYKKWWFWTGIGVAVVAASVFALTRDRGTVNDLDPSLGIHDFP